METPSKVNSKAVICIILGSLTVVIPLAGIVTGIIGIVYYRLAKIAIAETGESGEGLAITGLVFNIVGLALQVLIILFFLLMFGFIFADIVSNTSY